MTIAGDGDKKASRYLPLTMAPLLSGAQTSEQEILYSCFRNSTRSAIFIDSDRNILFANAAGERLLSEAQYLTSNAGRLQPAHSGDRAAFLQAQRTAFDGQAHGVGLIRNAARPEQVGAYSIAANAEGAAAAVTFLPPWTVGARRAAAMFEPYDLTPAEKHIAECLVSGYSLSEIAEMNDISLSTVKSHVKRIYQKTLVESRIEFMNQFMLLVAVWL